MSKLQQKLMPAQNVYEAIQPLTPAESISFRNEINDPLYRIASTFTNQIGIYVIF